MVPSMGISSPLGGYSSKKRGGELNVCSRSPKNFLLLLKLEMGQRRYSAATLVDFYQSLKRESVAESLVFALVFYGRERNLGAYYKARGFSWSL